MPITIRITPPKTPIFSKKPPNFLPMYTPKNEREKVMIFIDGDYLRRVFKEVFGDDKINFLKLRNYMLDLYDQTPINPFRANLIRVYFYDGITNSKEKEYEKQKNYFDKLSLNYFFLTVRLGEAVKTLNGTFRQKGVDILMAIDALTMAYKNHYDTGLFLLKDRDFIPLIKAVKEAGKKTFQFSYVKNPVKELTRVFDFRYGFNKPVMEKWRVNVFI